MGFFSDDDTEDRSKGQGQLPGQGHMSPLSPTSSGVDSPEDISNDKVTKEYEDEEFQEKSPESDVPYLVLSDSDTLDVLQHAGEVTFQPEKGHVFDSTAEQDSGLEDSTHDIQGSETEPESPTTPTPRQKERESRLQHDESLGQYGSSGHADELRDSALQEAFLDSTGPAAQGRESSSLDELHRPASVEDGDWEDTQEKQQACLLSEAPQDEQVEPLSDAPLEQQAEPRSQAPLEQQEAEPQDLAPADPFYEESQAYETGHPDDFFDSEDGRGLAQGSAEPTSLTTTGPASEDPEAGPMEASQGVLPEPLPEKTVHIAVEEQESGRSAAEPEAETSSVKGPISLTENAADNLGEAAEDSTTPKTAEKKATKEQSSPVQTSSGKDAASKQESKVDKGGNPGLAAKGGNGEATVDKGGNGKTGHNGHSEVKAVKGGNGHKGGNGDKGGNGHKGGNGDKGGNGGKGDKQEKAKKRASAGASLGGGEGAGVGSSTPTDGGPSNGSERPESCTVSWGHWRLTYRWRQVWVRCAYLSVLWSAGSP